MSLQSKRRYAIIILTVFSFIIVTGIGNFREKQLAVNLVGDRVSQVVSSTAAGLDVDKVQQIIKTRDEQDPEYMAMRKMLIEQRKEHGVENIYILYKDEQELHWLDVVDAREEADPAHVSLGKIEKGVSSAVEKTIRGIKVDQEYHVTSLGTFVSSYQEIKDEQGKTFAVLGADIDAAELTAFVYTTRYAQLGIIGLVLVLIGGLVRIMKD